MKNQKISAAEIGRALGLSRSSMSKYKKAGMPVHSLEAARAWREARIKETAHGMGFSPMPRPKRPKLTQLQNESGHEAISLANRLMMRAADALSAGNLDRLVPDLRAALAAVPQSHRDHVLLCVQVMDVLTADVRAMMDDPTLEREALHENEHDHPTTSKAKEMAFMGDFWYQVAAGEVVLNSSLTRETA